MRTRKVSVRADASYAGSVSATSAETDCLPDIALSTATGSCSHMPDADTKIPCMLLLANASAPRRAAST